VDTMLEKAEKNRSFVRPTNLYGQLLF